MSGPGRRPRRPLLRLDPHHGNWITIGRDSVNDVVLEGALVSRQHARIRRQGPMYLVEDGNSRNGTQIDGHDVQGTARLAPGSRLTIGRTSFVNENGVLAESDLRDTALIADRISFALKSGVKLMDTVGFVVPGGSLVAVVGPSGAGKSTLLRALTGAQPATQGRVYYSGRDLYDNYQELRSRIGVVPQDDVVHRDLTVRHALNYAAELRFPSDYTRKARQREVNEVMDELGLTAHKNTLVKKLSGGQRKRVSVAMELLTEPTLLLLDEPTSGLDPSLDRDVMELLREQARGDRSVLVVTHSVNNLADCDYVMVLAPGGLLAYYGPPSEIGDRFGTTDYADIFDMIKAEPVKWGTIEMRAQVDSGMAENYGPGATRAPVGPTGLPQGRPMAPGGAPGSAPGSTPGMTAPGMARPVGPGTMPPPGQVGLGQMRPGQMPQGQVGQGQMGQRPGLPPNTQAGPPRTGPMPPSGPIIPGQRPMMPGQAPVSAPRPGMPMPQNHFATSTPGFNAIAKPRAPKPSRQFSTLVRRQGRIMTSDISYAVMTVGAPIIMGLFSLLIPGETGFGRPTNKDYYSEPNIQLLVMTFAAALLGSAVTVNELVRERPIHLRERAVGLSAMVYLLSKVSVLALLSLVQSILLVGTMVLVRGGPEHDLFISGTIDLIVAAFFTSFGSGMLCLLISAVATSTAQTMLIMILTVMLQLLFTGGVFDVTGQAVDLFTYLMPSRWGFGMAANVIDLKSLMPTRPDDWMWDHSAGIYLICVLAQIALAGVFFLATLKVLQRQKPTI